MDFVVSSFNVRRKKNSTETEKILNLKSYKARISYPVYDCICIYTFNDVSDYNKRILQINLTFSSSVYETN